MKKIEVGERDIWKETYIKKEKEKECPLKSQTFCSALLHSCTSVEQLVTIDRGNLSDCRLPWWSQMGSFTSVVAGGQKEYSRY